MKIKKYPPSMKSLLLIFVIISLLSFSKNTNAESYKASLKKAIELDRDGFFEESIGYWETVSYTHLTLPTTPYV